MVKALALFALTLVGLTLLDRSDARGQPSSGTLKGDLFEIASASGAPEPIGQGFRDIAETLTQLTALEVSTAPTGTSTGGFTYTFDPTTGSFSRSSSSFGPSFAERSLTTGRGRFSLGANWLHASYNSFGGLDLDDGELITLKHVQDPTFDGSSSQARLEISSDTVVALATFGVTNDLDIGIAAPWVRVSVSGIFAALLPTGEPFGTATFEKRSEAGLGDIALVAKYRAWHRGDNGIATQIAVHLPTGDEDNLRGTGVTRTEVTAIWSRTGNFSPHVNVGYEFWSADVQLSSSRGVSARNQLKYAFGAEFNPHPRATILFDLVGRRLLNGGDLGYAPAPAAGDLAEQLSALPNALDVVSIAPGVKWNVWKNVLLTGNLLVSLANNGLRAKTIPVIGLDCAF